MLPYFDKGLLHQIICRICITRVSITQVENSLGILFKYGFECAAFLIVHVSIIGHLRQNYVTLFTNKINILYIYIMDSIIPIIIMALGFAYSVYTNRQKEIEKARKRTFKPEETEAPEAPKEIKSVR